MSDYTPTTSEVREAYAEYMYDAYNEKYTWAMCAERFERWHGAHDQRVRRAALRDAADRFGVNVGDEDSEWWDGYRQAQRETIHKLVALAQEG